jgi:hypothetical protein
MSHSISPIDRLREPVEKKFPKLAAWKRDHKARTILVLKDNDMQLTNQAIVTETFLPLALERLDRPDQNLRCCLLHGPVAGVAGSH